jgi:predicted MFS family arabinose efflux permease
LRGLAWAGILLLSATTVITECHGPRERNKVQAFNDFLIFGSMAVGSFSSGALLSRYGWTAVTDVVLPLILGAILVLAWGTLARRPNPV